MQKHRNGYCLLAVLVLAVGLPAPVRACMSYELDSVHFHSGNADFGALPRRASIASRGEHDNRPAQEDGDAERRFLELDGDAETQRRQKHQAEIDRRLAEAANQAGAGQFGKARAMYAQLATAFGWTGNLRDRYETMQQAEQQAKREKTASPALLRGLQNYLYGMAAYDGKHRTDALTAFETLYKDTPPGSDAAFLREHALYQQASLAYEWLDFARAVDLYQRLLREFPQTVKREAALIMIARCAILPATDEGRRLQDGETALATLRQSYPASRFRQAIAGLQARIDLLEERYDTALRFYFANGDLASVEQVCRSLSGKTLRRARADLLAAYLKRLTTARSYSEYAETLTGIDRTRRQMTPLAMSFFNSRLRKEPDTAAAYLYFRLNHTANKPADLKRLAGLADALLARHAAATLSPEVQTQFAEVYYQDKQYDRALQWANRALAGQSAFAPALYVRGAAMHKLHRLREAAGDFDSLLNNCPDSPLRPAAREEAALLAEALGDWSKALEQYFDLGYSYDIAYLLDVRMTSQQLEAYLRQPGVAQKSGLDPITWHENQDTTETQEKPVPGTRHDLAAYSLGIRYLREAQWDKAEKWLKTVPKPLYLQFSKGRKEWASHPSPDPLTAIQALRPLYRAISAARTQNTKADALYRCASYYYSHGTLLLYNPALWQQRREVGFDFYWNPNVTTKQDTAIVRNYMYQHEVYARSRALCLEIVQRYPRARVAPQALYRAACSSRALANFNGWWRDENKRENHWIESIHLMKQLARRYPRHPLAKEAKKYAGVFNQERQGQMNW